MTFPATFESSNRQRLDLGSLAVLTLAVLWVIAVVGAALSGVFDVPPGSPAIPTLVAVALPIVAFAGLLSASSRARNLLLDLDPSLLTSLQAWRVLGGVFLVAYSFAILPGLFAWPAGLGDVAIGVLAPFVARRLREDPDFLYSRRFLAFNLLGLADFVVAIGTGLASRNPIPGVVDEVTTSPMGELPLVLIPTLAVPTFIILHLIVMYQAQHQSVHDTST